MQNFGLNVVVTLNAFATDTEAEHNFIKEHVEGMGCEFALARVWEKGGEGGIELANKVLKAIEKEQKPFTLTYSDDMGLKDKVKAIATKIYGAKDVSFAPAASKMLDKIEKWDLQISLYVWQRHSIHFRMTRLSLDALKVLPLT